MAEQRIARQRFTLWVDVPFAEDGYALDYTPYELSRMLTAALRRFEFETYLEHVDTKVITE